MKRLMKESTNAQHGYCQNTVSPGLLRGSVKAEAPA
jgi:hypothetical protein